MPATESQDTGGRPFERWLATGVVLLTILSVVAFLRQRNAPQRDATVDDGNVLRIELGGRDGLRPVEQTVPPQGPDDLEPDPEPGPKRMPDVPPVPIPLPPTTRTIVVRDGDTLGHIAQRELGSTRFAAEIQRLNGIDDARSIREGDELLVPVRPPTND